MNTVQIFIHGLIALVPATNSSGMANHMTALLVDAREKPAEFGECFAPHQPSIKFLVPQDSSECGRADCTLEPGAPNGSTPAECICPLVLKEVSLQAPLPPDRAAVKQKINSRPSTEIPFSRKDAKDFSYVANLSSMGYELDRRYVDDRVPPTGPTGLIARMSFPFESATSCFLGTRRDEESDNVHPLSFRPVGDLEKAGEPSQALAQAVLTTFETEQNPVTLTISDFGGGNPKTITLAPIDGKYELEFYNVRMSEGGHTELPPDDKCDGDAERDFQFFYNLVSPFVEWKNRPVPHIKYTRWKSSKDLDSDDCALTAVHLPTSHPICALASFTASSGAGE